MVHRRFAAVVVVAAALAAPATAHAGWRAAWRAPVEGASVAAPFAYDRAAPFRAGQRRGLALAAAPGALVLAPCAGRVSFAGRLPGGGQGVSVRCGSLTATLLGLDALRVDAGRRVARGAPLGRLGAGAVLRLGARRTADRWGWIDPARLLAPAAPPPGAAPAPGLRRGRPRGAPVPVRRRAPLPAPARAGGRGLLAPLWAGVALLAAGLGAGGLVRRRSSRPRRAGAHAPAESRPRP
jgi:hypothetical protein